MTLTEKLYRYERDLILQSLIENRYNVTHTSKALGIKRVTLISKMKKFNIPSYDKNPSIADKDKTPIKSSTGF